MAHPDAAADGSKASPKLEPDAPPDSAQDAMEIDSAEEQAAVRGKQQELREDGAKDPDGQDDAAQGREDDGAQKGVQQNAAAQGAPKVSPELYEAMAGMLEALYEYRDENGDDPSRIFHKRPNRRNYREYYDIIKEPMAMSVIKAKINTQTYVDFREFVRDCALIWHNAMVYNKPISEAYQHSQILKGVMAAELRKIVDRGTVPAEEAEWPDLGPIPPVDEDEDEGDDDENADGEEDSDDENDGDDDGRDNSEADKSRRRGRRPSGLKRVNTDSQQEASNKRRGRPPKVDTPLESRMKNVLKAIRRPRYKNESPMIIDFEKLPDRNEFPDYFTTIARPICLEQIKRFMKRKRYATVSDMVADLNVMFDNALQYNEENSEIWRGAQHLKALAHTVAVEETAKPDSAFSHDEGRKPKPGGIMYKGQLWKVGDWVHIQNPNTANSKPIVAQIYRTWQEEDGRDWINACWYYRPEQTVHHFEKHFWPNEVLKTSQYRDHPIEQVIDQCFVMFFTRFNKGRPKGLPAGTEVYVCEARYNEEKHRINKIKTWSSCLPDEVRDQNYEMEPFEVPRRIKKLPSPLTHLIPGAKDHASGSLPQPKMGAEDAPPIEGGVYKGARDENQSPPPSPSPSPPPQSSSTASQQQHTARPSSSQTPARPSSVSQATPRTDVDVAMADASRAFGIGNNNNSNSNSATMHANNTNQPPPPLPPATPQGGSSTTAAALLNSYQQSRNQTPRRDSGTPGPDSGIVSGQAHKLFPASMGSRSSGPQAAPNGQGPMVLFDNLNNAIDPSIREQFHTDDQGRVLFFDRPPLGKLNYSDVCDPDGKIPAHMRTSIKYRAQKLREKLRAKMVQQEGPVAAAVAEAEEDANRIAAAMDVDDANALNEPASTSAHEKAHGATTGGTDGVNQSSYNSNKTTTTTTTTTPKPAHAPAGSSSTSTPTSLPQPKGQPPLWKTNPITLAETGSSRTTPSQILALDPRRVLPSCEQWAQQHYGTSYLEWCAAMHASNLYLYRDACNSHDHWRDYMDESVGRAAAHWQGEFAKARQQAERAREVEAERRREEMRRRRDIFKPPRFYIDDIDPMHVGEWTGPDPWGDGHPLSRKEGEGAGERKRQQYKQQQQSQQEARGSNGDATAAAATIVTATVTGTSGLSSNKT